MNKGILVVILAALPAVGSAMQTGVQERPPAADPQEATRSRRRCLTAGAEGDRTAAAAVAGVDEKSFVIGPEDQIQVDVWGDPRIRRALLVRPDGKISLILWATCRLRGRTPVELANDITEMLQGKKCAEAPAGDG